MTVLQCKRWGGHLELISDNSTTKCEYCGTVQTIPVFDDEKKIKMFARANKLRFENEFDKASGIFENNIQVYIC